MVFPSELLLPRTNALTLPPRGYYSLHDSNSLDTVLLEVTLL